MTPQAIILSLAPRHVALAGSWEGFNVTGATPIGLFAARIHARGVMTVWEGASDKTIWRDARVNHAFRAWHDQCHIRVNAGFTLAGERLACEEQIRELMAAYPRAHSMAALIRAEVIGQAEHFARTGIFPEDQIAFHAAYAA